MPRPELVLGTRNKMKGLELLELLAPFHFELRNISEFPNAIEVEETGSSFAENAALKATQQARQLNAWVLGEDSGLCVEALRGEPGIYSARYAGSQATDANNNAKLLHELTDVPWEKRTAHYVCYAVLSDPNGSIRAESEGRCYGRIRTAESGQAGFGYDPLFEFVEYHQTFGELGNGVKSVISHRSRALRAMIQQLVMIEPWSATMHRRF
jgi:XTP/dITP diphosphohydrolase